MSSKYIKDPAPANESLEGKDFNVLQEENQIYRWANWIKFISVFCMIESICALIYYTTTEIIPTKTGDGRPLFQVYFLNFASFVMSYFGYIVSISKSSKIVLNYLIAYIFYIIFQTIVYFSYLKSHVNDLCDKERDKGKDCDERLTTAIFIVLYFILLLCVWIPILYCPLKLYKSTKNLEKILIEEANSELNDSDLMKGIMMRNMGRG